MKHTFLIITTVLIGILTGTAQEQITIKFNPNSFQECPSNFVEENVVVQIDSLDGRCYIDNSFGYRNGF